MRIAEKEHKKIKKIVAKGNTVKKTSTKTDNSLPVWFDKDLKNEETSKEEVEELNKILEELV